MVEKGHEEKSCIESSSNYANKSSIIIYLVGGYHQIPVFSEDIIDKTEIIKPFGLYEYLRMLFTHV